MAVGGGAAELLDQAQLPPPGASQMEVLFRRMLAQCSARCAEQQAHQLQRQHRAGGGGLLQHEPARDWRSDPKFHCVSSTA